MASPNYALYTAQQISQLSAAIIASLPASTLAAWSATQIGGLSAAQTAVLSASQIAAINPAAYSGLSNAAVRGITASGISGFGANFNTLGAMQLYSINASAVSGLTAQEVGSLNSGQMDIFLWLPGAGRLSAAQVTAISTYTLAYLSSTDLNNLGANALSGLSAAQVQALSVSQLSGLTAANLAAINCADFDSAQVGVLGASNIAAMTTAQFDSIVAPNIGALSASAIKAASTAELASLSALQAANITVADINALSSAQASVLVHDTTNAVLLDAVGLETNGQITYNGALQVLQDAAAGGMTAQEFYGLQIFAAEVDSGQIGASTYVNEMIDNVVEGNIANAWWNGGSNTGVALGNLSASSTQAQVNELIGKWFLGTDMPATSLASVGESTITSGYTNETALPLWGANGPQVSDVNQGSVGDCYFVAALAATAAENPTLIENMIQSNGNGTYSVDFKQAGADVYVTVDDYLPTESGQWADGSNLSFANGSTLWAPLIEKAFAQLMAASTNAGGADLNSYATICNGSIGGLTAITGAPVAGIADLTATIATITSDLSYAFANHEEVMMGNQYLNSGNLVASHMYSVLGFNASTGAATLQNPWNQAYSGTLAMNFTETVAQLANNGVTFYIAQNA